MSIVTSTVRAGLWGVSAPSKAAASLVQVGLEGERRARAAVLRNAGEMALQALDAALASPAFERALEKIVTDAIDREATREGLVRVLESDGVERLLDRVLTSQGSERLVAQVLDSPVLTETVTRLLESEQLWILVSEIATSPPVTDAISAQGFSFVDQVTDRVRDRSRDADAWVERAARRVAGRGRVRPRTS